MSSHFFRRWRMVMPLACVSLVSAALWAGGPTSLVSPAVVPVGLPPLPVPAGNPQTFEKIELGKRLFFDPRLSRDGTISCATCHSPQSAWTDRRPTSRGIGGQLGTRNAPTILNAAYHRVQFWDGRAANLEEQALGPIENPLEMASTLDDVCRKLSLVPEYKARFRAAFETGVTAESIGQALAAFERTILSGNSPYDRYVAGDESALTQPQLRGMNVFMDKADCAMCHTPPTFSNGRYYNAGVGMGMCKPDPGRKEVTHRDNHYGRFRVPSLRDVERTAPYFHDGSARTLEEAVAIMAGGGIDNPHLSRAFRVIREAELTAQDRSDLVEFLKTLSGDAPVIEPPVLPADASPTALLGLAEEGG